MTWRIAKSLDKLLEQFNTLHPKRSKISDGGIGDAAHASRSSDHNPWVKDGKIGVVTARDFTHDPANGMDCNVYTERLRLSGDKRIKYIIWNRQISNPDISSGAWRKYTGSNPHTKHFHLSVKDDKDLYDNTAEWALGAKIKPSKAAEKVTEWPIIKEGSEGKDVQWVQIKLGVTADSIFGPRTKRAVQSFQQAKGLEADGIVGPYTWEALERK